MNRPMSSVFAVVACPASAVRVATDALWRDRTVDLLLVASAGCTPARHNG